MAVEPMRRSSNVVEQATHSFDVAQACVATPVGVLAVAVSDAGLARVGWLRADESPPAGGTPGVAEPVVEQLQAYFGGELQEFDLALDWSFAGGTRLAVLQTLYDAVAFGESVTYGELAERSGTGAPARAVGGIMGSNQLPIVVPCHRVLAHDGLGGYSGGSGRDGLEVKRWLLTMEGVLPPTLDFNPAGL